MKKPYILFQTDFGIGGGASMYGMCKLVDPELKPLELSHMVPTFNVREASERLVSVMPHWPKGTIFISVVDPGVGTPRKACIAKTANGWYVVTPDNGTLTHVKIQYGIEEIREINEEINRYPLTKKVSIFHGRDLFAYCAARLASGIITYEQVGPAYSVDEVIMEGIESAGRADGQHAMVVMQTDFGHDGGPAIMHGICKSVCFALGSYDLCHEIPVGNTVSASDNLRMALPFWPRNTVFVSVVGADRSNRACVAKTVNGYYVVTPDNGTLTQVARDFGIAQVRRIEGSGYRLPGPELYTICAARLAAGILSYDAVGPAYPVEEIVTHEIRDAVLTDGRCEGFLHSTDGHFGNLSTNVLIEDFERMGAEFGDRIKVTLSHDGEEIFKHEVVYHKSFGHVPIGDPIVCNGITSYMTLGLNQRSFILKYPVGFGPAWKVVMEKI